MMRWFWIWLARRVPSRLVTARLVPWFTLLLAMLGAGWTFFQYTDSVAIQRSNTTFAIHRQFLVTFPNGAQDITGLTQEELIEITLRIRCKTYEDTLPTDTFSQGEQPLDCQTVTLNDLTRLEDMGQAAPDSVREQIRDTLNSTLSASSASARRMMTYFRSLQVCAERHQCDRQITSELFAGDIVAFLNLTCELAKHDAEFARQGELLGTFMRTMISEENIPWNTDGRRKSLFTCEHLRI